MLKSASLFVTHCGLNSVSEAVHFGVPMICLPLATDTFGNAHRVATELGLGVLLEYITLKESEVILTAKKILNDKSYQGRCDFYSNLSSQYEGHKNGANIIKELLFTSA